MLPTPSTSHIPSTVYPPSEDSYLLLDTLSSATETAFLSAHFPPSSPAHLVVELGTGSGVVLAFVLANAPTLFGHENILGLGIDVNPYACKAARETVRLARVEAGPEAKANGSAPEDGDKASEDATTTAKVKEENGQLVGVIQGDLSSTLRDQTVDVLIFNPPYVPTPNLPTVHPPPPSDPRDAAFEEESHLLELAYAGGDMGMETTERFLGDIRRVLSFRGVFYLLLCTGNKPEEVKARIREWKGGWRCETVGSSGMKGGWEKLVVIRGWRE